MRHDWTAIEEEQLNNLYSTTTNTELVNLFGRSIHGIRWKARQFGLKKQAGARLHSCERWTPEQESIFTNEYPYTRNVSLAKRLNRTVRSIEKRAQQFGLRKDWDYIKKFYVRTRLTEDDRNCIRDLYIKGKPIAEIGKLFHCGQETIWRILSSAGIETRNIFDRGRKYNFNQEIFNDIDSEAKSYWAGFITADGSVGGTGNDVLSITLSLKDKKHLEKFKEFMESTTPIKEIKQKFPDGRNQYMVRILLCSKRLKTSLLNLGITPNKSLTVRPCSIIPEHLMEHYWRGVFDGDGWISIIKPNGMLSPLFRMGLCGNLHIVKGFHEFIKSRIDTKAKIRNHRTGNCWAIHFGGKYQVPAVANLLYLNASIYLDRKKDLYDQIKSVHMNN